MAKGLNKRIVIDAGIMAGKPVIRGTRIPGYLIIKLLAQGMTPREILEDYPNLRIEDIKAALTYVAELVNKEEVFTVGD